MNNFFKSSMRWMQSLNPSKWLSGLNSNKKTDILKLPPPYGDEDSQSKQNADHSCPNYMELKMRFRDIGRMNGIIEALGRDFLTAMPEGAYKSRLGQISFLARRSHEDLANEKVADLIQNAHKHQQTCPKEWDDWDRANLFEMETMYRHYCKVDPNLVERRSYLSYEGRRHHREVLKNNDWPAAKEFLQEMIDLQRQIAEAKCFDEDDHKGDALYQSLLREYTPGISLKEVDTLFDKMHGELDTLLPQILEKQAAEDAPEPLRGGFDPELQLWLNKSLLDVLGFDFNRGGLYETGHNPVEGGTPDDTRLVIKTSNTGDFLESMKSALHEGGHGLYIQGLPRQEWRYQPVGQDLGAAVQESQALIVEMIFGRNKEFFEYLSPRLEGLFQKFGDKSLSPDNLYKLKTRVRSSIDRKNADEVTYFYHVHLRTRLERDLISGRLAVKDLPEAWNEGVKEFTGKTPESNAHGCLQDVHWFVGKFGYFPAYTLGHMMAAQIKDRMAKDIQNINDLLRYGDFIPIREWLNQHVHAKGRSLAMQDLLTDLTGSRLSEKPLIGHFRERYLEAA